MRSLLLAILLLASPALAAEPQVSREDALELELVGLKLQNLERAYAELSKRRAALLDKYGLILDAQGKVSKKPKPEVKK